MYMYGARASDSDDKVASYPDLTSQLSLLLCMESGRGLVSKIMWAKAFKAWLRQLSNPCYVTCMYVLCRLHNLESQTTPGRKFMHATLFITIMLPCIECDYHHFPGPTAEALAENTTVTYLDLNGCDIGADGMALLSSSLRNKSSLESLDLSGNKFGSKEAEFLGRVMLSII